MNDEDMNGEERALSKMLNLGIVEDDGAPTVLQEAPQPLDFFRHQTLQCAIGIRSWLEIRSAKKSVTPPVSRLPPRPCLYLNYSSYR